MFDVEEKFFRLHSFARKAWSGLNPEIDIIEKVIRCQLRLRMSASRIAQDLSVLLAQSLLVGPKNEERMNEGQISPASL